MYRDALTGRFISAEVAFESESAIRSVYDGGLVEQQILTFGSIQTDLTPDVEPNWIRTGSQWGTRWFADDEPLSLSALQDSAFPEQFDAFRVTYFIPNNPDYPRPYASAGWMTSDQWPPSLDLLEGVAPTGISQIVFRNA